MDYKLKDLLDVPRLRELLDTMDEIHSMPSAVIDIEGNILTATAWQDICTKFHRVNPDTEKKCIESDTHIGAELDKEMPHVIYRCPMGLVDAATPIIIEGNHLGNVFTGQLFMAPPDEEYFINQARQYEFDENDYLAAMRRVPFFPEEKLHKNLAFIHSLTQMLAEQGLQHKRQCEAENALREREKLYRNLFANAGEGIFTISTEGRLIEVNESFAKMHGYSYLEMQRMELKELDTPETFCLAPERIRRLLAGEILTFEVEHYHKDGHVFPLEVTANLVSSGGESFIQCFHRDISERRQAEAALTESENRYRSVFNNSPVAIGIGNIQSGQLVEVNDAWLRLFGYERNEVIGRTIAGLSLYVRREERDDIVNIVKEQGRIVNRPVQLRQKSGSVIDILYSAEAITFGKNPCLQVIMTDVTERKRVETELFLREQAFANSERFLKTIIDSEPECIKMLDINGNLLMMNRAGLEMIGADSFEQVNGQCVCPLVTDSYRDAFMALTKQVFQGISGTLEFEITGLKGRHVWLETHAVPFRNCQAPGLFSSACAKFICQFSDQRASC